MSVQLLLKNKKVLFITTKNVDYIRNVQEIRLIEKYAANVRIVEAGILQKIHGELIWSRGLNAVIL